jgi:protein subunit release factor A
LPGYIEIQFEGNDLSVLKKECGGHRIQRIPPTERKGRIHTSTVTVAIIDVVQRQDNILTEKDIEVEWYSGSGAGGQHRNKHQNSCRITHKATGIITTAQTRSRQNSYKLAFDELNKRISEQQQDMMTTKISADRKMQVGSGMRGDKIRTYRFQDDIVVDHRTGKKAKASHVMRGNFDLLW